MYTPLLTLDDEWDSCGGRGSAKRTHRIGKYVRTLQRITCCTPHAVLD